MTTQIPATCVYQCGPYKGYWGRAFYDQDDKCFSGEVVGTKDVITFVGGAPDELVEAFVASVDDYLAFCKQRGESPEKPFSGQLLVRMPPELHRDLANIAEVNGESLNSLVVENLWTAIKSMPEGSYFTATQITETSRPRAKRLAASRQPARRESKTRTKR